jgi:hypothetical protein
MGNKLHNEFENTDIMFNRIKYKLEANDWDFMTSPENNVMKFKSNLMDTFMVYKFYQYDKLKEEYHSIFILNELGQTVREYGFKSIIELFHYFEHCMYMM